MALIQVNYVSNCLLRTVPVQVILPVDKLTPDGVYTQPKKYRTLYLLNGLWGNHTDWVTGTRIQRWAEERDLAVVMPAGENSFYIDRPGFHTDYGKFIGEELVEMTRRMFPLSDKREDTFIGGLSMGGFGAMRNGLKYSKTFGRIIALSAALHIFEGEDHAFAAFLGAGSEDWERIYKSDLNPRYLLETLDKKDRPEIYMACGLKDDLLPASRLYRGLMAGLGYKFHYAETPGGHDWDFWDTHIKLALDWLPLDGPNAGLSSGNVKTDV